MKTEINVENLIARFEDMAKESLCFLEIMYLRKIY